MLLDVQCLAQATPRRNWSIFRSSGYNIDWSGLKVDIHCIWVGHGVEAQRITNNAIWRSVPRLASNILQRETCSMGQRCAEESLRKFQRRAEVFGKRFRCCCRITALQLRVWYWTLMIGMTLGTWADSANTAKHRSSATTLSFADLLPRLMLSEWNSWFTYLDYPNPIFLEDVKIPMKRMWAHLVFSWVNRKL